MVYHHLSNRQGQLLRLHCEGKGGPEIAAAMDIRLTSVNGMRQLVKTRLRTDSMDEICRMADAGETPPAVLKKPVADPWTPGPTDKVKRDSNDSEHPPWRRYPTGD